MFLMIDNYDSFVYNLVSYMEELKQEVQVVRNDALTVDAIRKQKHLDGIIISPGPGNPDDGGISLEVVKQLHERMPILGVCLGHQIIGHAFGARVIRGNRPMHGKVTRIHHSGNGVFAGLPSDYDVTRYHSLVLDASDLPEVLRVDAVSEDGAVMAASHRSCPTYGIQFHPEAVLTEYGHQILENFIHISQNWRSEHGSNLSYHQ